jgi:tetratricopeptide (TPR) repeat protein
MAKKKKLPKPQQAAAVKSQPTAAVKQKKATTSKKINIPKWVLPVILLITFLAFIPALRAGFVLWDDPDYVNKDFFIGSSSNFNLLLTESIQGNHHPLTMLSLALNYAISGDNAWSYHLLNLLLHLINCFLVFRLALLLSNKNSVIAFTTAVLFGVHPLHVESVAWISERKDVLYGLFFLAGLISYTKYADTGSRKQYLLTILFLILSLVSKPAAVIFPVALFCIDFLRKRKLNFKLLVEKIPFFIFALIMGIITVLAQKEAGATGDEHFAMGTLILFGFYGIMMYVFKMIAPFNLSPFYPFPPINENLPVQYYIAPVFFIGLAILIFATWKKNRAIGFGILFYLVNLLLVLQVFSVGSAVIADRYTYIPYIGLFYALGWLIDRYARGNIYKASYIIIPLTLIFAVLAFKQSTIWFNGETMWKQAVKVAPSSRGYSALGVIARKERNNDLALEYYNEAIKINLIDNEAFSNRGNIYFDQSKLDLAYNDYKKALSIKPDYYPTLDNLGALFALRQQYDSSLKYLDSALKIKPDYKPAYRNRGLTYMKVNRNEEAIKDFEKFLEYEPNAADIHNTIGICYRLLGKYQEALAPINKAIQLEPDPHFYMNRSYAYFGLKNMEQAKKDALTAKQGGIQIEANFARSLGIQ